MLDSQKVTFSFGQNWKDFSKGLTEERLAEARRSLTDLFGAGGLRDLSFLDIGCGSGLFSIAAAQLGARRVVGVDVDPLSVETSQANAARWSPEAGLDFRLVSILDEKPARALGEFDVVYSWGVLHHTGDMRRALALSAGRVRPGGKYMIAIYNRHWSSPIWSVVKRIYNRLPVFGRRLLIWAFAPVIFLAKFASTGKNPLRQRRGMDFFHNLIDWLGGYPYEYASIPEMTGMLEANGLQVLRSVPAGVPTGCNEFICIKPKVN
jgi:2-polyprenyl-6-hydroxyphenyl methylase/3-demethylubiquinone-9 3-methyltransferase